MALPSSVSINLLLRSLKTIRKETAIAAMILGRTAPDPRFGSPVELSGSDASGLRNLIGVGKTLSSQRIAAEEAPPALLQVEPARPSGNEHLMDAWMLSQPGTSLEAVMAAEVIGDNEDVARGVIGLNVGQQGDVAFRVARSGALSQFLAIAHTQRSIDPGFLGATTVIQKGFDAVPIGRPAGRRGEGAGNYWPQFVGADGRRALGRLSVVADDRRSFGTKSSS
jgi:hypothetical protein